jgi:hypothetical protein
MSVDRDSSAQVQGHAELDAGDGHGAPFECWHTDSYELSEGAWQAVWSQATAIKSQ